MSLSGMNSPWADLAQRVGIALVHSLWQGALVGLMLVIVLVALRRARAQPRYLACCLALAATLLLPIGTFLALAADGTAVRPAAEPVRSTFVASAAVALEAAAALLPDDSRLPAERPGDAQEKIVPQAPESGQAARPVVGARDAGRARPLSAPARRLLLAVVAAWSAGVILLSCRVLGGYVVAWRLTRRLVAPLDEVWQTRLRQLARRLGIDRPIEIWQSAAVEVPAVLGCFRPVMLVPIGMLTGLPLAQVESILAHELAHIRRYDFVVNALQSLVETLLFYHPCVWWISARIREEREHCCDETAVAVCGDALIYARALTGLEELRPPARLAMALSGGGPLLGRIRRILGQPRAGDVVGGWLAGSLAILLPLAVGGTWGWAGVGDQLDRTPAPAIRPALAEALPAQALPAEKSGPARPAVQEATGPGLSGGALSGDMPASASGPANGGPDFGTGSPENPARPSLGDPPLRFLVRQRPRFNGPPEDLLSRMVKDHGSERVAQVVVSGLATETHNYVYQHLGQLLPNLSYSGTGGGDTVTVHLAPIDDLDAFAARIDLGEIRSIDRQKRLINVVADRARLPRHQARAAAATLVADGPAADAPAAADLETLCRRLVELDRTAVQGLVAYGPEAEPAVGVYVEHEERRVRRAALLVLKRIGTDASLPALLRALADPDVGNRDLAWQAICKVPGLTARREVTEAAVAALARQPEQAAKWLVTLGPSAEAHVWPSLRLDDPRVRLAAANVLGQIGTATSLPALDALGDDEVDEVVRAAGKARQAIVRR